MKITKYNHACLLVEDKGKVALIDPGNYSEGILPVEKLTQLDYILITHEHEDHFYMPLIKQLVAKFLNVKIIGTQPVVEELQKEGIAATTEGDENITVEKVPHEKVWGFPIRDNIMVTVFGKLAHPGDSHTFKTNAEVLALPVAAPWGSTARAVEIAEELKPKIVIPIHDAMLKDESRKGTYKWIASHLKTKGIDFKEIENGETVEV